VTETTTWTMFIPQLPKEPSRHRVAVWRELRRVGAVPVASGAWIVPENPAYADSLAKAGELVASAGGTFAVLDAVPRGEGAQAFMRGVFVAARLDEWAEFEADCGKFEAEIAREIAKRKFTFGELEEEEQSLDRLRRWYRDLKRRDAFELPEAVAAENRLQHCSTVLDDYAERVYAAMRQSAPAVDLTGADDSAGSL
jgi:hypothetical protein